ncbi:MAG: FAD-dependent oxidoreductase [Saezia sp.]
MADYEVIIVGAGLAGSTAAYCLAKAGISVLLLERGDAAGSKNVTGGRFYAHSLERIMPGFAKKAPVERKIIRETISMMTDESCFSVDFNSQKFINDDRAASYTVLRSKFDAWLAGQAEEAGADFVAPTQVDRLLMEGDKVTGVIAGDEQLTADVIILADGVNSLLAQQIGMKKELTPSQVGVGVKEVLELPEQVINDRFGLNAGEGTARLFVGDPTNGMVGGGFLYTNKNSISLGLVVTIDNMMKSDKRLPDLMEAFKNHPAIQPLIKDAKLAEYSAHMVPEGGIHMLPTLNKGNVLLAGDAAGFCLNLGYTIRGMDYAILSGEIAAQTIIEAKEKGALEGASLSAYQSKLEESIILRDMKTFRNAPGFIEHTSRMFKEYPQMMENVFYSLFSVNEKPAALAMKKLMPHVKQVGLLNLAKDGWKGIKAL